MSIARVIPMLAFVASLTSPLAASAQSTASPAPAPAMSPLGGEHHHRHHESLMHALRSLNLTAAQQQQVASFRAAAKTADQNADQDTVRANGRKLHSQIMGILTPDQQAQLKAQMHRGRAMGTGEPAPQPSPSGQ